jgi:aminoglycoside phosphotransferase (APT) family kinase protein
MPEEIPLPPLDASLGGLRLALTPARAVEILAEKLVRPEYELAGCSPCYLRYKRGQSCLILYRLDLRDREGAPLERLAHARLYAAGRAEQIWSRGRIQALAGRVDTEAPLRPATYLRPLGAVVQSYPLDISLPPLARLGSLRLVRYKPGRKALIRDGRLYAKVYADDRGARAFAAGRALHSAGIPVLEPLRYSQRLRMLVHAEAQGIPLTSLRGRAGYDQAAGEAGVALRRLHATTLSGLPKHSWHEELSAAARAVGVAYPKLGRSAARLADRLSALLEARDVTEVAAHGDFYDDQLLVSPDGVIVLDLDRAARADAELDLGTFLAHLSLRGEDARAREAFLSGYERALDRRAVVLGEASALLKLAAAPFRALAPDWPEQVERRLVLAERRLAEATPKTHVRRDEALPQLEELVDACAAGAALGEAYGQPVRVLDAVVIRHRPGRRCTLRYDLSVAGRAERVYAKVYASERAPQVLAAMTAIASASACGPGVALPEPLGCVPRLHLVVQREVPGTPATPRLLAGDQELARRIARALHALHSSAVELERRHGLEDELGILSERLLELPRGILQRAQGCFEAAACAASGLDWRLRPVHRDLYHEQVLVDGERLALLDFDDAALSEPAVDVANFLAHLRLLAQEEPRSTWSLDAIRAAFEAGYAALDPTLDVRLLRLLEATTLLRLACIHLPRRGPSFAQRLISSSDTILTETA